MQLSEACAFLGLEFGAVAVRLQRRRLHCKQRLCAFALEYKQFGVAEGASAPVLAPAARAESGHAPSPRELPRSAPSSEVRAEEEEVRRKRWRPSIQLAQAAEEEVRAEKRKKQKVLRLARDGLSVEVGSESSGRMEDVEFRLQKDGWLLISRFFEEQLGPQALGLVKSMTQ